MFMFRLVNKNTKTFLLKQKNLQDFRRCFVIDLKKRLFVIYFFIKILSLNKLVILC